MSLHGDGRFDFGGEERDFRLGLGEIRKLQERTNAGPFELLRRLSTGQWRIDDVRETIRLGLEGGGMAPKDAGRLVRDYVDPPRPLLDGVAIAARILDAALSGPVDDPIPKSVEAEAATESSGRTASSPSPRSSAGGRASATPPMKSTPSPSGNSTLSRPAI